MKSEADLHEVMSKVDSHEVVVQKEVLWYHLKTVASQIGLERMTRQNLQIDREWKFAQVKKKR